MKVALAFRKIIGLFLGLWALTACSGLFSNEADTPQGEAALGSISGTLRVPGETCGSLRVFAHELKSHQVTDVQTQEGTCDYSLPGLPAGDYLVVGWYYPSGVSGAHTSLETVMAVGEQEAQACEDALVVIALEPGEDYDGADIGCWGGDFFDIAEPGGQVQLDPNRWQLASLQGQEVMVGTGITLMFQEGRFYGSAGCNNYGGKYARQPGGGFGLDEIEVNTMLCLEPEGVMAQEEQYLAAFIRARRYIALASELQLLDEAGNTILTYELMPEFEDTSPSDLVGVPWRLVAAPGLEGVDLEQFTLAFDELGFSGSTTCRDYAGTYRAVNDRLRIGFLVMTSEPDCKEELLLAEGAYTTLLESAEQYHVLETQLELVTIKGEVMVFQRLEAP